MEENILQQDMEDEFEEDMEDLEKEVEEKPTEPKVKQKAKSQGTQQPNEPIKETYEAFAIQPRLGIMNTLTGETIEGFKLDRDEGTVQLGKMLLNKLDKISLAMGE